MNDLRFYAVYPSSHGGGDAPALRWSKPLASIGEAAAYLRNEIDSGNAPMGFLVRAEGNKRAVIVSGTQPKAAKKAVERYIELLALTKE